MTIKMPKQKQKYSDDYTKKVIHVKNVSLPTNSSTLVSLVCYINLYYFTVQHFTIQKDV